MKPIRSMPAPLDGDHDPIDGFVTRIGTGLQPDFGMRAGRGHQVLHKAILADRGAVPIDRAERVDVDAMGRRYRVHRAGNRSRKGDLRGVHLNRHGQDEHDQQHQHHFDERGAVHPAERRRILGASKGASHGPSPHVISGGIAAFDGLGFPVGGSVTARAV
jgi:hypothetical protein